MTRRDNEPYPAWDMPTRSELNDGPEALRPKRVLDPCTECSHYLCMLQRRVLEMVA